MAQIPELNLSGNRDFGCLLIFGEALPLAQPMVTMVVQWLAARCLVEMPLFNSKILRVNFNSKKRYISKGKEMASNQLAEVDPMFAPHVAT